MCSNCDYAWMQLRTVSVYDYRLHSRLIYLRSRLIIYTSKRTCTVVIVYTFILFISRDPFKNGSIIYFVINSQWPRMHSSKPWSRVWTPYYCSKLPPSTSLPTHYIAILPVYTLVSCPSCSPVIHFFHLVPSSWLHFSVTLRAILILSHITIANAAQ